VRTRSFVVVAGLVVGSMLFTCANRAEAQGTVSPRCSATPYSGGAPTSDQISSDACQKAVDLFNFMAPQLGVSITGGNPVIGSASTLGGLGHFTIGVRANVVRGQLPQTGNVTLGITGAQSSNFAPKSQVLGLPTADAAIGIFKGVGVGLTNVGGVDALVSAFYVPNVNEDPVDVRTSDGALRFGYGARVGILQETSFVPGVSVSYLRRDLPTVDIRARVGPSDSVRVTGLKEKTSAWRLAASKGFTIVSVTAGVGRDSYDASADAGAYVAGRTLGGGVSTTALNRTVASASQKLTRTNIFAGASLNLAVVRLAAEVGRVTGGSVTTPFNRFGDRRPDDPYTYGSIGLRVGF
jgi:hypothetical protein